MLSSAQIKDIVSEARPIIERQLDDAERIAAFRDVVAASGGDWSALKALIKAQIQDERDESGDGKRVRKILEKADFSTGYADMLGWSNMNEKNFSAVPVDREARRKQRTSEAMDDNKALSAELLAAGLITEEAHAENVHISDGVARKMGAGVIDPETGEILESERSHDAARPSEPAESSSDTISAEIQESPSNRDVSADGKASPLAGPQAEASPSREQETGTLAGHEGRSDGEAASVGLPTFNNPRCRESKTCPNAHSRNTCHECLMAWSERPVEEQKRLWAEAIGDAA